MSNPKEDLQTHQMDSQALASALAGGDEIGTEATLNPPPPQTSTPQAIVSPLPPQTAPESPELGASTPDRQAIYPGAETMALLQQRSKTRKLLDRALPVAIFPVLGAASFGIVYEFRKTSTPSSEAPTSTPSTLPTTEQPVPLVPVSPSSKAFLEQAQLDQVAKILAKDHRGYALVQEQITYDRDGKIIQDGWINPSHYSLAQHNDPKLTFCVKAPSTEELSKLTTGFVSGGGQPLIIPFVNQGSSEITKLLHGGHITTLVIPGHNNMMCEQIEGCSTGKVTAARGLNVQVAFEGKDGIATARHILPSCDQK